MKNESKPNPAGANTTNSESSERLSAETAAEVFWAMYNGTLDAFKDIADGKAADLLRTYEAETGESAGGLLPKMICVFAAGFLRGLSAGSGNQIGGNQ